MRKKILTTILLIGTMVILATGAYATHTARNTTAQESMATDLKALNLFQGVSDNNFDLNRTPTRVEALVILIRSLGKEADVKNESWNHPFIDVPLWADPYIGYAYETGLTKGTSATTFGTGQANSQMFLTFMLRALGYSDTNGLDFTYDNPYTLSKQVGILTDAIDSECFWRADIVTVTYTALQTNLKDSEQSLADKLINAGVFTENSFNSIYQPSKINEVEKSNSNNSSVQTNNNKTNNANSTNNKEDTAVKDTSSNQYIANINSLKFHRTNCTSAKKISKENRWDYTGTRDALISLGYSPCKICHP